MEYENFRAMNSEILLAAEGVAASSGFELAHRYIEASEKRFTRFSPSSEMTQVNQGAGKWTKVSADMYALLETALACYTATNGLFDPTILPDLEQAGYTKSIDELRIYGGEPLVVSDSQADRAPFPSIELRRDDLSVLLPTGMRIDLGGIAKGWIAEQAAWQLAKFSPTCAVSAGGDMFLIGTPPGQDTWDVGLEDPLQPNLDLMTLAVESGAVATSSVVKRAWQQGNTTRHHLIDPRTGQPAITPWLSVTVMAPRAATAEVFAKALLIGGPEYARVLMEKNPELSYLAVDANRQVWIPESGDCVRLNVEN
jgi:thiamine biosynthesis lipoprotein